ncbi:MAG: hypothetical protein COV45_05305 [Deltaproteobacteria bacterium CG11_big_fil_rev_8_21_14_0_20_47_16]|nr:MAG: hypothetical protein COV45_05305 [Deltaproteobacteria bacterium CG11_big_fil_rev_8_21_14_0_20_47_16]
MKDQLYMDGTKLDRHVEEVAKWKAGEWFAPIHMEISPSKICNQDCSFCYIDWSHGSINMPEKMLIDLIRDGKRIGMKSALIAGEGEPTVNKAYIKAIEVAGEVGLDVALNSNATLFDEEALERILPHLSWMRISVQSADPNLYAKIHNSTPAHFERMVNNVRLAAQIKRKKGYKCTIGMQQVLLKENGHDVANLATLAKEVGADYYVLKPCHVHELNKHDYQTEDDLVEKHMDVLKQAEKLNDDKFKAVVRWNFLSEKKRTYNRCLALPFIIQIGANGDVYTCYPWANKKEHCYGSLRTAGIEEIVKSENFKKTCGWVENNVNVHNCMLPCRQHNANNYLWWLTEEEPRHNNFI